MLKLKVFYLLFFLIFGTYSFSQTEIFKTNFSFSESELSNFLSSITLDEDAIYVIANDYKLYSIEKKSKKVLYTSEINSKSNNAIYILKDTLITSLYENEKQRAVFIDKNSGQIIKKLNVSTLKTKPFFINDTVFISTCIEDGGQLISYDLKSNAILWKHFVGHGAFKNFYIENESILANFDYDEWKIVSYDGIIAEEIFEEDQTNNEMQLLHEFYVLTHDRIEINQEFLYKYFSNIESLKVKANETNTVILNQNKIVVLGDNAKVITNKEFKRIIQLPNEGENDYLEILKIEKENVWFFYENTVVNFNFKKNRLIKTYDVTKWNAHQVLLEGNDLWLISITDGQLYHLKLELTEMELAEKAAMLKKEKEQGYQKPDKARIEAQKAAEEKFKSQTK